MRTYHIRPCPVLLPYIHTFAFTSTQKNEDSLLLDQHPTGYTALAYMFGSSPIEITDIVNKEQFRSRLNFTGQLKQYTPLKTGPYSAVYAVFKPMAAMHFFSQPQHCFTDAFTELSDVITDKTIYQRLADCDDDPQKVIATMENWLLSLLAAKKKNTSDKVAAGYPRLAGIVNMMTALNGRNYIDDICTDFNIPQRTLEAQFRNAIGISPKTFSRMLRINHAHRRFVRLKKTDWQEIVHECNYFDQAHFIKEFKTFFGHTPAGPPSGNWNLSDQLLGYEEKRSDYMKNALFTDISFCSKDKKNGPAAFTTDPEIYSERGYLATFA